MGKNLVIVESPTKAKTIGRFLGSKHYHIESSYGHIRDLPKSKMGVDIKKDFAPTYVVPKDSQKTIIKLKKLAKDAEIIYFATDEDREGEAIAWHLTEIIQPEKSKIKRIVFHEITKEAIEEALKTPRNIDPHLVNAQQARRVLDRLVGYELSPFLWRKVARGLSAGRVQSVAVRLIVEREREIQAFKAQEFWTIEAVFEKEGVSPAISTKLFSRNGEKIDKLAIENEKQAHEILSALEGAKYRVASVTRREVKRSPLPPFTTSTLQQEANRKLGYSAKKTMRLAQQLYEGVELGSQGSLGLITYMRTDSLNLSNKFLTEARGYLEKTFGNNYVLPEPRMYKAKSRLAQEAHEAIRPTEVVNDMAAVQQYLAPDQFKLYMLIWNRAVASQMPQAIMDSTTIDINTDNDAHTFRATGSIVTFDGFLKVYPDSVKENQLPDVKEHDSVTAKEIKPVQHFTEPPARYSEAGLVKALEEDDIGRPSTYASIISTILDRGYVMRDEKRLKPSDIGMLVNDLLVEHFPTIVDFKFTAHMEDDLDEVAQGQKEWVPVIKEFYGPFKENLMHKDKTLTKKELTEEATEHICEKCGRPMIIKMGRFGKFLACTGYPECKNTKPLGDDGTPQQPKVTDEKCPTCGKPLAVKRGRFGEFFGCTGYPECKFIKNIEKKTGVTCPQCNKGDIVEKRSRRGRIFYSCNRYPECKFALWSKPTGEKCPESGDLLVYAAKGKVRCSSKECKFEKTVDA
ncbi:MAG: DNA topoisomerase I [Candidatus Kerfeldbacteria bacterium RIFCSPLOWO2_01_FULL_48_11]|uniref:DNA topoisomerase 1 n=1 Tax=Candidatus Kerfeldbacteria bacterium RIFCSPLOWO2_01_FULL_48_11 TaxID=1798543 RepID=A0A1G2B1J0_9BACT|nr:MAG: topoisomerase protein [Parcubacteria group bacterium GW2011_GWA2_48_9]OGY83024.1 MAG: DNA topoisomerase I [Candidatus Kerfeldbacteria bacterium RIFCSPLOWO2_01_FULL_48_11]